MSSKKNNFITRLFRKKVASHTYDAREYDLWPKDFHSHALEVVATLQKQGFEAYIVGGGVRDQLLGMHPKDFDIATNAEPAQVKKCFNRCIIIGKRFRLAHVYFGRYDFIEVATFRKDHASAKHHGDAVTKKGGLIARDNVYGTLEDDAIRRDFTLNALYYNPANHELIDFSSGMMDLEHKILRLIGKPQARLREDPVRILRAIRIANKTGCVIDETMLKAIPEHVPLLQNISGGRLFDEYQKLFLHGQAVLNFNRLAHFKIIPILFPILPTMLHDKSCAEMVDAALKNTDLRASAKKTINPAFLIAVFLWHGVQAEKKALKGRLSPSKAYRTAAESVLKAQTQVLNMPRYLSDVIYDIWALQRPLELRRPTKILETVQHPRYRAAYDFLLLRTQIGQAKPSLAAWWEKFYLMNEEERHAFVETLQEA
jgi:poly(A) polymerase